MTHLTNTVTPHFVTSKINDGWWEKDKEYTVLINVMTDGRIQFFDNSVKSGPNLKIYKTSKQMFNEFEFDEIDKQKILERLSFYFN